MMWCKNIRSEWTTGKVLIFQFPEWKFHHKVERGIANHPYWRGLGKEKMRQRKWTWEFYHIFWGKKKKKTPFETFIPLAPFLHWSRFAPWSKHTRCPRESGLRLQEASNTEIIKLCNLCQSDMWQMVSHSWLICISWLLKKWNILSKMCRPFEFPLLLLAFFSFPWFDVSALFFILFSVLQTYPSVSCTSYSVLNFFWGAWYFFLGFSHSKISIFLWDSCFYFVVHFV